MILHKMIVFFSISIAINTLSGLFKFLDYLVTYSYFHFHYLTEGLEKLCLVTSKQATVNETLMFV